MKLYMVEFEYTPNGLQNMTVFADSNVEAADIAMREAEEQIVRVTLVQRKRGMLMKGEAK